MMEPMWLFEGDVELLVLSPHLLLRLLAYHYTYPWLLYPLVKLTGMSVAGVYRYHLDQELSSPKLVTLQC